MIGPNLRIISTCVLVLSRGCGSVTWQWNGKAEGAARRDVIVWRERETWSVEDREGGEDGWSRTITAISGDDAAAIAGELTGAGEHWQDMQSAHMVRQDGFIAWRAAGGIPSASRVSPLSSP